MLSRSANPTPSEKTIRPCNATAAEIPGAWLERQMASRRAAASGSGPGPVAIAGLLRTATATATQWRMLRLLRIMRFISEGLRSTGRLAYVMSTWKWSRARDDLLPCVDDAGGLTLHRIALRNRAAG